MAPFGKRRLRSGRPHGAGGQGRRYRHRRAAVRLDLEGESVGTALSRVSNRVALIFLALVVVAALGWWIRTTDWSALWQSWENLTTPAPPSVEATGTDAPESPLIEEIPEFRPVGNDAALNRLILALNAGRIGQIREAENLLEEAAQADATLQGLHFARGLVAWAAGDVEAAREHFRASILAGEEVAAASSRLGDIALARHDVEDAVACYRRAMELYPNDPWVSLKLSVALRRRGETAAALSHAEWAVRLLPYNRDVVAIRDVAAWDAEGRPIPVSPPPEGAAAFRFLPLAWDYARRGDMAAAASALRALRRQADPALMELAAVDIVAIELRDHEELKSLLPVLDAPVVQMPSP